MARGAPPAGPWGGGAAIGGHGGERKHDEENYDIVDHVPDWFIAGHRKEPTDPPPGRPKGAKDSYKRAPYRKKTTKTPKETALPVAA